ncbi:MAG: branched-chain amino acid ABC transporter permease [Alphaproteobacteria bacterium]|nr:branched-chain amino acid ABC transporter permease [Alphaproteobacteria bacterium]
MLAQQLVNGVLLGATYALFALGFTLMFGVLRVVNLVYGVYFTAGAFVALFLARDLGLALWLALPVAAVAAGAVAVPVDALLLSRLRRTKAGELASLMVTLGAALALYAALAALVGPDIQRLPPHLLPVSAIQVGSLRVGVAQLLIIGACAVLAGALLWLMRGTRVGLAIRAMAETPEAAELVGINTGLLAALVSFVSGALAGAAGVLIGLAFNAVHPYMGEAMMLRGFAVIIAGGLGDIAGALVAGLVLGIAEVLTAGYFASGLKEAVAFALLVLVLWTRPSGLFGHAAPERV